MNIRLTFLVVIGLIVLAVVGIWHFSSKPETVTPIPSSGGALIDITPQDNGAYFLQTLVAPFVPLQWLHHALVMKLPQRF
ncbi:MAG: hypothetical protein ACYTDW_09955 [Planctomycetota bacterium]